MLGAVLHPPRELELSAWQSLFWSSPLVNGMDTMLSYPAVSRLVGLRLPFSAHPAYAPVCCCLFLASSRSNCQLFATMGSGGQSHRMDRHEIKVRCGQLILLSTEHLNTLLSCCASET